MSLKLSDTEGQVVWLTHAHILEFLQHINFSCNVQPDQKQMFCSFNDLISDFHIDWWEELSCKKSTRMTSTMRRHNNSHHQKLYYERSKKLHIKQNTCSFNEKWWEIKWTVNFCNNVLFVNVQRNDSIASDWLLIPRARRWITSGF